MANLTIDTAKYFVDLRRELTEDDMNSEPETTDPIKAQRWLDSRIRQLNYISRQTMRQLSRARHEGYLEQADYQQAERNRTNLFDSLEAQAREEYNKATQSAQSTTTPEFETYLGQIGETLKQ